MMAKYLLGKQIFEAVRFEPEGLHKMKLPDGVVGINSPNADNWAYLGCEFHVATKHGPMPIQSGDYLLSQNGQLDVCKGCFFESAAIMVEQ